MKYGLLSTVRINLSDEHDDEHDNEKGHLYKVCSIVATR